MWDPIVFKFTGFSVRWYGIAYFLGIMAVLKLGNRAIAKGSLQVSSEHFDSFITSAIIGIIVGGRLSYMLFYQLESFVQNPWSLFKIWHGGMSFHGGFAGVLLALLWHYKRHGAFWTLCDFVCRYAPIGLLLGRFANFINGELYGRIAETKHWWLMVYPWIDQAPRHPSQIYEMLGEGVLLFLLLNTINRFKPKSGIMSALFCFSYGILRFVLEFFREPDYQLGFVWHNWLTMGQLLSVPMIISGLAIFAWRQYARKI